jgi:hypothetical protein
MHIEEKLDYKQEQNESEGSFIEVVGTNNQTSEKYLDLKLDSENLSQNSKLKEEFI